MTPPRMKAKGAPSEILHESFSSPKYSPTSADFQAAITQCIAQAHSDPLAELESLLTLKFQTFTAVPVLGEEATVEAPAGEKPKQAQVYLFPKRKQAQKKISSKAA